MRKAECRRLHQRSENRDIVMLKHVLRDVTIMTKRLT